MGRCPVHSLPAAVRRGRRLALAVGAAGTNALLLGLEALPVHAQGLAPYLLLVTNGPGGLNVQPGGTVPANGAPGGAVRAGSGLGLIPKLAALVVLVVVIVLCLRWLVRSVRASQSARRSV